ncbi:MAG TPA: antitoxin [Candidatus Limnocylindria bacterium]|nr:antitoxin [Candidatus Limnocylindria bacterium]
MPRTTIDLEAGVLRELKRRRRETGRSIGQIASELLTGALQHASDQPSAQPMRWRSAPMSAKVDLEGKEALRRALDGQ